MVHRAQKKTMHTLYTYFMGALIYRYIFNIYSLVFHGIWLKLSKIIIFFLLDRKFLVSVRDYLSREINMSAIFI